MGTELSQGRATSTARVSADIVADRAGCKYFQTTAPNPPMWVSPCSALPGRKGWLLLLWQARAAVLAQQLEQDQAALEENKAHLSCGSKARGGAEGEQHAGQLVVTSHCPCPRPLQLCLQAEHCYTAPRRKRVVSGAVKLLGLSCSESIFQAAAGDTWLSSRAL